MSDRKEHRVVVGNEGFNLNPVQPTNVLPAKAPPPPPPPVKAPEKK